LERKVDGTIKIEFIFTFRYELIMTKTCFHCGVKKDIIYANEHNICRKCVKLANDIANRKKRTMADSMAAIVGLLLFAMTLQTYKMAFEGQGGFTEAFLSLLAFLIAPFVVNQIFLINDDL
jgi:hypothetical protein